MEISASCSSFSFGFSSFFSSSLSGIGSGEGSTMRIVGEPVVSRPGFPIGCLFFLGTLFDAIPGPLGCCNVPSVGLG